MALEDAAAMFLDSMEMTRVFNAITSARCGGRNIYASLWVVMSVENELEQYHEKLKEEAARSRCHQSIYNHVYDALSCGTGISVWSSDLNGSIHIEGIPVEEFFKAKADKGKVRWDLLEWGFIEGIASVLTMGAEKYSENSWRDVPNGENQYFAAAHRHIKSWRDGDVVDEESELPHLMHAACNLMFLDWLTNERTKKGGE